MFLLAEFYVFLILFRKRAKHVSFFISVGILDQILLHYVASF